MFRKRLSLILLAIALIAQPLPSAAQSCPGISAALVPLGYQQLTVSSAAVALTLPTSTTVVRMAVIMVEANPIRFRDDGTNPTASVGMLVQANVGILVCGAALGRFRAIASASDSSLSINYYGG